MSDPDPGRTGGSSHHPGADPHLGDDPSGGGGRRPERTPGTIKVGTIAGSDVLVTPSWFLIAALIAFIMAPAVESAAPGLGVLRYVAGLAFAVILYGAVLLHEAAHAYVARHYGYPVGPILLHFLGGATTVEAEAKRPRHEFWIAVVGPLTSLAVAGAAYLLYHVFHEGLVGLAIGGLFGTNLFVGLLNLVPGLPLDGGRLLKAGVWTVTGNVHRGSIVAGWVGRVVAFLALLWPFAQEQLYGIRPSFFDYALGVIIAMFLWSGASAAIMSARVRAKLPSIDARKLARRTLAVPVDLPLAEAVRRAQEAQAGSIVTVTGSGEPVGLVHEAALVATPEDRRPWVSTSNVARRLGDGMTLPADITGEDLIKAITRTPAPEYLLVETDGSIYGVLATADVDAAFRAGAD